MAAYRFDFKEWPVVVLLAEGDLTAPLAETHFREYRELLDRNQRYALVFDASKVGTVGPNERKLYVDFLKKNAGDFRMLCTGVAFVITSPAVRGMLTAILWLTDLPFPHRIVGSVKEAKDWLHGQL